VRFVRTIVVHDSAWKRGNGKGAEFDRPAPS
jgi:hypothetical protein